MGVTKTNTGRIVCSNAAYVHITPWLNEDTIGAETFDIIDIVGDTLSFTPDDNTVNSKEAEFKDDPLFENITLGKYQFAGTCIDFQNTVMKAIYGWETDEGGNAYAPVGYTDKYATIEIGFRNEDVIVVAPKVKMNSKATFANFKTGSSEGAMAGTAYSDTIKAGTNTAKETSLAMLKSTSGTPATYTIKTKNFKAGDGLQAG